METKLEKKERLLGSEKNTLQILLDKRNEIDLLIKHQQENICKIEELKKEKQYNELLSILKELDITYSYLTSNSRKHHLVACRQSICLWYKENTSLTLSEIGERVNRDYSTVHHSIKKTTELLSIDDHIMTEIWNKIKNIKIYDSNDRYN